MLCQIRDNREKRLLWKTAITGKDLSKQAT